MKKYNLHTTKKNYILVLFLLFIIFVIMYVVIINITKYSLEKEVTSSNNTFLSINYQRFSFILNSIIMDVTNLSNTIISLEKDQTEKLLYHMSANQILYSAIHIYDANDNLSIKYPLIQQPYPKIYNKIIADVKWRKSYVISDFFYYNNIPTIAVAYPILDSKNNYNGTIITLINLYELSLLFSTKDIKSSLFIGLIDQNNRILVSNTKELIGTYIENDKIKQLNKLSKSDVMQIDFLDKKSLLSYMPIYVGSYGIIIGQDIDRVAFLTKQPMMLITIFFLGIFILGIFIAIYQAVRFINPIDDIIAQIKALGANKIDKITTTSPIQEFSELYTTLNDVTYELLSKERRLAQILEAMPYAVISMDITGLITTFNKQAEVLTHLKSSDVINKSVFCIFHELADKIKDTINNRVTYEDCECVYTNHLGEEKIIKFYSSIYSTKQHSMYNVIIILRDIEYVKRLETILHRNEHLSSIGQLVAGISHELKNPLSIIQAASEAIIIENRNNQESLSYTYAQDILTTSERMNKTIVNFLKMVIEQKDIVLEEVNIVDVLKDLFKLIKKDMQNRNIVLKYFLPTNKAMVLGNSLSLTQVFLNIILNAIQAIKENGLITVLLCVEPTEYTVTISDSGCGIEEKKLKTVFNAFYSTKNDGTGLGLSISNEIIHKHNGSIWATSEVGVGSNFFVSIPKLNKQ